MRGRQKEKHYRSSPTSRIWNMQFCLKGEINHYDTKQDKWIKLQRGDVQIIRAGNGISHAEITRKFRNFSNLV